MSNNSNDSTGGESPAERVESQQPSRGEASEQPRNTAQAGEGDGSSPQGQQPSQGNPERGRDDAVADRPAETRPVANQPGQTQPQDRPRGQPQGQAQPQGTGGSILDDAVKNVGDAEVRAAQYGTVVFGVLGFGYFVYEFLSNLFGSGASTGGFDVTAQLFPGTDEEILFVTVAEASSSFVELVPLVAIGLAVYYHWTDDVQQQLKTTLLSVTAGVLVVGFSFLAMAILFAPDGIDIEFGTELVGLLGIVAGSVGIAGGVSLFLQEDPLGLT